MRLATLPEISIARFDGDVKKWPLFIGEFNSIIGSVPGLTNSQRMAYLHSYISKKVQNTMAQFMYDPNLYPQAIAELQRQYDHPYATAKSRVQTVLDLPTVKKYTASLVHFANQLNGVVAALSNN